MLEIEHALLLHYAKIMQGVSNTKDFTLFLKWSYIIYNKWGVTYWPLPLFLVKYFLHTRLSSQSLNL